MAYVDGYLVPLSKTQVEAYRKLANAMADIYMEFGAL